MFFLFCSAQKGNKQKVKSIRIRTAPISNTANSQQKQAGGNVANFFFLFFCDLSQLIKKKGIKTSSITALTRKKREKEIHDIFLFLLYEQHLLQRSGAFCNIVS